MPKESWWSSHEKPARVNKLETWLLAPPKAAEWSFKIRM